MKRIAHIIIALLGLVAYAAPTVAQSEQLAFYVHRNDGEFNVMFFSEVDSMVYSRLDVDSVLCEQFVTQEIWTPDTVVRIPIAAIDSVTFQTPSNIMKPEAVELDQGWQGWIERVDSLTLYFSTATPVYLIPEEGARLVYADTNDLFPNGFIGRVKSVEQGADHIVVDCDQLSTSDVFDRFYCNVEGVCEQTADGKMTVRKKTNVGKTISVPTIELSKTFDFGSEWKMSDECKFGAGASITMADELAIKLRYSYIDEYGDKHVSLRATFDNTFSISTSLFGSFTYEKDMGEKREVPIPNLPLLNVYVQMGPRFGFTGNLGLEFEKTVSTSTAYSFVWTTNSNMAPSNGFKEPKVTFDENNINKIMGSVSFYGGVYIETGLSLITKDFACCFARFDAGKEFVVEADLSSSLDNAATTTDFYEQAGDLVSVSENQVYTTKLGYDMLGANMFHFGEWRLQCSIGAMIRINEFTMGLMPEFVETRYVAESNDGQGYLECELDNRLLLPVPVGFKVFDDNGNEVMCQYYDLSYNGILPVFNTYRIPYTFDAVNRTYTAYPVFKLFDKYEVLGAPALKLSAQLTPVTVSANVDDEGIATLKGLLTGDIDMLSKAGFSVGFFYGTTDKPQEDGIEVGSTADAQGQFAANIEGLDEGTTYYYCAFICTNNEYSYGEVKSFDMPKKEIAPENAVDLGLSVLWAQWNVGATAESEEGGLYGWADASGENTSYDVIDEDLYVWTSTLYGGTTPPSSICGNAAYDIATAKWGGSWRLPSETEMVELMDNCDTEWTYVDTTPGMRFTSKINGNSIFLPAAGDRFGSNRREQGNVGYYWTGTLDAGQSINAYRMVLENNTANWGSYPRYIGHSVRPVMDKLTSE